MSPYRQRCNRQCTSPHCHVHLDSCKAAISDLSSNHISERWDSSNAIQKPQSLFFELNRALRASRLHSGVRRHRIPLLVACRVADKKGSWCQYAEQERNWHYSYDRMGGDFGAERCHSASGMRLLQATWVSHSNRWDSKASSSFLKPPRSKTRSQKATHPEEPKQGLKCCR
jgi:hypothetical protein